MLGNLKTGMAGTYHSFDHARYAQRYLAEFCWRFNRRFDLPAMLPSRLLKYSRASEPAQRRQAHFSQQLSVCWKSARKTCVFSAVQHGFLILFPLHLPLQTD